MPSTSKSAALGAQLQAAVGDRFVLERELGGGGMARVFVARETALGRQVVLKVLPPELVGVNLDRFRREIQLAAQLQHPHIVPVLAAEEAGGLLFYSMPFIEGQSLRARLATAGAAHGQPLAVREITRILRDVAEALAYAHDRGVVHRDIKPDNVLMHGAHALVTDFGVAKAIAEANLEGTLLRGDGHAPSRTGAGVAIGTPAYMAPEQAAGDPDTDHRADIYAFGLLAYELLAGRSPFAERTTAQEIIAAQIAEPPVPVDVWRRDTPVALAALVMRCLEKHPANRPQTAQEVLGELDAAVTPDDTAAGGRRSAGASAFRRRRAVLAAAGALLVALATATALMRRGRPPAPNGGVVAVAPFRMATADPALRYLREGMLDLLAAKLTGEGGPRAADPRLLLGAWRRAAGSDTTDLSRERALRLAERLGAGLLLQGGVSGTAGRLVVDATLLDVHSGRPRAQGRVEGPVDSLPQLVDRLAAQVLAIGAGEGGRLTTLTSTSLPALRAFLQGQWLYRRARYHEAAEAYERALRADSTFALAALGLAVSAGWTGEAPQQSRALALAWAARDRLSARDIAFLESVAGPRFPRPPSSAELIAAKRRYLALAPDRADAWFEYGDAVLHYGALTGMPIAGTQAAEAFRRTLALDSTFAPAVEHLLMLTARAGDTAQTRRLAEVYLSRDSAAENADGVRWRLAAATGDQATLAAIERRAARLTLPSVSTILMLSAADGVDLARAERVARTLYQSRRGTEGEVLHALLLHDLALMRGRPRDAAAALGVLAAPAQQQLVAREQLKDALFEQGDATLAEQAAQRLAAAAAVPVPPTDTLPQVGQRIGALCVLELWRLGRGDATSARRTIGWLSLAAAARAGTGAGDFAHGCTLLLDASLATHERAPDARARVQRLDSLLRTGPANPLREYGNLVAARLFDRVGDAAGALAAARRRDFFINRSAYLASYLREEGRLAEQLGDVEGAIDAYRHFLRLRAAPAPELRREVETVRTALARLERLSAGG